METVYLIWIGYYEPTLYMVCTSEEKANQVVNKLSHIPPLCYVRVTIKPVPLNEVLCDLY